MFSISEKKDLSPQQQEKFQVAVVFSRWHTDIIQSLVQGATKACFEKGLKEDQVHYYSVPGAYELPQMVDHLAKSKKFQAIVPLGCVIRGETDHYDLIVKTVAQSLSEIGIINHTAVSFGVVTVESEKQAWDRAGGQKGNLGAQAAHAALELAAEFERE